GEDLAVAAAGDPQDLVVAAVENEPADAGDAPAGGAQRGRLARVVLDDDGGGAAEIRLDLHAVRGAYHRAVGLPRVDAGFEHRVGDLDGDQVARAGGRGAGREADDLLRGTLAPGERDLDPRGRSPLAQAAKSELEDRPDADGGGVVHQGRIAADRGTGALV